ncbi:MAG: carotenoid biosynthesis protein [Bacteroidota bacterium]
MERKKPSVTVTTLVLVILHQVGAIGLQLESSEALFQSLVPVNLMLTVAALAWYHRIWNMSFGLWVFGVFWGGYLVELLGVKTGVIFGEYYYGDALGPKVAAIPPLMGMLWVMLAYIAGIVSQKTSSNLWLRVIVGSLIMVGLDLLIEPAAPRNDFWYFRGGVAPFLNYFAWFVIAALMQLGFHRLHQEKTNPLAYPVLLIQIGFFLSFLVVDMAF